MDTVILGASLSVAMISKVPSYLLTYIYCFFALVLLRIVYKLLTETHNEYTKLKPSSSQAILVTGATSGIGLSLCKYFHRLGYSIIVAYYSDQELGYAELVKLNKESDGLNSFHFVNLNVRSQESIADAHKEVSKLLDSNRLQLFALINNAGVAQCNKSQWDSRRNFRSIVETNLLGPILMVRQFFPLLKTTKHSRVVNVASIASFVTCPLNGVYGATKVALAYYTRSLSVDFDGYNVHTVAIHPGNLMWNTRILTPLISSFDGVLEEFSPEERQSYGEKLRRIQHRAEQIERAARSHQDSRNLGKPAKSSNYFFALIQTVAAAVSGSIDPDVKLEDSQLMDSFDNALRLEKPPREMFAGGSFYRIVVGTWLECMSYWVRRDIFVWLCKIGMRIDLSLQNAH